MRIELSKEHEDWLRSQVAAGRFASFDEAVAEALAILMDDNDEFEWAKPLVEEGLAELQRGEAISADEVFARIEARLRAKT